MLPEATLFDSLQPVKAKPYRRPTIVAVCGHCRKEYRGNRSAILRGTKKFCSYECACRAHTGEGHPLWKGDRIETKVGGRTRCQKMFKITPCERCGKPGRDRHHKDGNTKNNVPSNVQILCRRCHMIIDGRLGRFVAAGAPTRTARATTMKTCVACKCDTLKTTHNRCKTCYDHLWRYGKDPTEKTLALRAKLRAKRAERKGAA